MKINARKVVLEILNDVEQGAFSNKLIQSLQEREDLDARDKGFISKIVYGVVENKLYLDYVIRKFSSVRLKKIDPEILNVLRMTAYQIIYLDKVPNAAAVDEGVKLAKKINFRHKGFVNALLRSLIKGYDAVELPSDGVERLSVKYSHPKWMVERFIHIHGYEFTEDLLSANNEEPDLVLRVNTLLINREDLMTKLNMLGLEVEKSDIVEEGIIVENLGNQRIDEIEWFQKGYFTIQDESSMMVGHIAMPEAGQKVLDLCAAPGGKATHMAQLMGNKGQVIACDVSDKKINLIKANVKRLGLNNVQMVINDATVLNESFVDKFDKVLLDAPCSGLGIVRRKPDIKYHKTLEDIHTLNDMQQSMLLHAAKYVKKGGELIYSTCTIEPLENSEMMDWFSKHHDDFERVTIDESLDLQMYPNVDETDGFYICKFRRK